MSEELHLSSKLGTLSISLFSFIVSGSSFLMAVSRSFLTSLTSVDVPLLCSPVPFQNAALSAPEASVI